MSSRFRSSRFLSYRSLARLALAVLCLGSARASAQAAEPWVEPFDFTLKAAIGGALPHASKDGYFVTTLAGEDKDSAKLGAGARLPFADRARTIFDPRPQVMVGGTLELGRFGSAALSLDGIVGAGTGGNLEQPEALLVVSGFRLVF